MTGQTPPRTLITNVGTLITGDLAEPTRGCDHLVIQGGRIAHIGTGAAVIEDGDAVHDAGGMTVLPGLIDDHVHPVIGDYTPRQYQSNYLEGFVHGGVTSPRCRPARSTPRAAPRTGSAPRHWQSWRTSLSRAGAPAASGCTAARCSSSRRPHRAGLRDLAAQGVHLVGEIGISERPGPGHGRADDPLGSGCRHDGDRPRRRQVCPHQQHHRRGVRRAGPPRRRRARQRRSDRRQRTSDVERILAGDRRAPRDRAQRQRAGRSRRRAARRRSRDPRSSAHRHRLAGRKRRHPLGILRTLSWITALAGVPAPPAVATASGNTARARRIEGGVVAPGEAADLVVADAPDGSQAADLCAALEVGDTPAVAAVIADGADRRHQEPEHAAPEACAHVPRGLSRRTQRAIRLHEADGGRSIRRRRRR